MISDARKPRLYTRVIALLISTVVLVNSAFAAPEATYFVAVSLGEFGRDVQNSWHSWSQADFSSFLRLPATVATAVTGKAKSARQIDRIAIVPGNVRLQQGDSVDFTAVAYLGEQAVGGVPFRWTISKADSGLTRPLNHGRFEARVPGSFVVRASADGFFAETTFDVVPNRGYGVVRLLRKQASDRTPAERQLVASWLASGALTTRDISSRGAVSIVGELALAAADKRKRDEAGKKQVQKPMPSAAKTLEKESTNPTGGLSQLGGDSQKQQTPRGPSAGDIDSGFGPIAEPMAPRKFRSTDPLGWDSGNWATADDPGNAVGRPIGTAKDDGASNGNFRLSVPAVNLDGRGIDINLNMEYNSRLWSKSYTEMTYNPDAGYPAPGWNLGFGRMYYLGSTGGCMVVAPDGTRRSYGGTNSVYSSGGFYSHNFNGYTGDGSLIDYSCNYYTSGGNTSVSGSARLPNGTTIGYSSPTANFDQMFPTSITDAHGNYINISYVNNQGPEINTITDTLGRTITFNYNGTALRSISGPGYNGTTRTYIRFEYFHQTLSTSGMFDSSLTTSVANTTPYQIKAIFSPTTNTGYWFGGTNAYSPYGMIRQVISQRGMNWNPGPDTIDPGTTNTDEIYNFPTTPNASLTDAPGYSTHTETWDGIDTSAAVTNYSVSSASGSEVITVTSPDGSKNKQTSYVNPGNYTDGIFYQNEILNPSNTVLDKTKMYLASGAYGSSRVTSIERTDEKSQMTKTEFTYGSTYNQVTVQKDYDYGGSSLFREKRFTYENSTNYTNRHIFNLVKTEEDYDNANNRLTRTVYSYDGATLDAATGVVQHYFRNDPYTSATVDGACIAYNDPACTYEGEWIPSGAGYIVCNCTAYEQVSAYDASTAFRGNLTNVTTYEDGATATGAISHDFTYDITGNQTTATTNCCQQISSSYSATTQFLQPNSITKGSSNTGSSLRMTQTFTYDANTKVPTAVVDFNGRTTTVAYDAVLRPTIVTLATGGKKTTTYGDSSLSQTELVQKSDNTTVSNSIGYFNGRGQINKSTYQAGSSNWNGTQTKYDAMGRQWKVSMPYDTGSSPTNWTESVYDYLSRLTQRTAPDGSVSAMTYNSGTTPSSASSSTGQTVKSSDAWGREKWSRSDAFGRLVEVVEPDPASTSGAVAGAGNINTAYAYDRLDRLTTITQGSQTRSFAYDSLGRMTRQKLAEQTATINSAGTYVGSGGSGATWSDAFAYDVRSNITRRTDARGVKTNFSYDISGSSDPLNRLQGISYDSSTADTTYTINAAPAITFEYMTTGDQSRVKKVITSGIATEENAFDTEGRISEYKLTLNSQAGSWFTTNYAYDTAHRLTQVTYPEQYGMTGSLRKAIVPSYDQASRLSQLNVDGGAQLGDISYNTFSQVTQLKTGAATSNPRIEAYSYDGQTGLLTGQTVKNTSATSTYLDMSYTYARGNSAGSLSGKTGQLTKIVDNLDRNRDRLFEFDSLARLKTAKGGVAAGASGVTANWTQSYSYDRYGNKTGVTASGVDQNSASIPADGLTSLSFNTANNRTNTAGWEYDLTGNLVRGQNASGVWQRFEYDAAGRVKKVKDDSNNVLETYTYGAGREKLFVVSSTTGTTYYVWGGSSIICEYKLSKGVPSYSKSYIYAGSRLLMTATRTSAMTEKKETHHPDRLGTKLVTDTGAGSSYRQSTLPFGTALAAESTGYSNQLFTSYDRSPGTGLDYATNRMYSQGQSGFTQVDPIGMASATIGNPQSNNLYAYTQNMPTDFVDPSGLLLRSYDVRRGLGCVVGADGRNHCIEYIDRYWYDDGTGYGDNSGSGFDGFGSGGGTPPLAPPPANNCGINPITGGRGINATNSGTKGDLRPGVRGFGHFGAPRNNGGRRYTHTGSDIAAPVGSSVFAFAPGTIQNVTGNASSTSGYGLTVNVDHGGGYTSHYSHLSGSNGVRGGDGAARATATTILGFSGQSGNANGQPSTEAHLHFEIRYKGKVLNPETFLNLACPKGFGDFSF